MTDMDYTGFDDPEYEAPYAAREIAAAQLPSSTSHGSSIDDGPSDEEFMAELAALIGWPEKSIANAFAEAFCGDKAYWQLRLTTYGTPGTARDFEHGYTGEARRHAVDVHWADICTAQAVGNGIYFYLNRMRDGGGRGYNGVCTNDDAEQLLALSVDFDGGLPDHYHVEPDIVIKTSKRTLQDNRVVQRGQALWLIWSSADFSVAQNAGLFKDAQLRLAVHYDPEGWAHRADKSWPQITDKSVTDLRRVHRLPGSLHTKDPANPQLVTFERRYTGPRRGLAVIIAGLPEITAVKSEEPGTDCIGSAQNAPIAEIIVRETLSYIDPPADEPNWRRLIAAIKATPLIDGDGEEVAVDWSVGRLDRAGRYVGSPPENWGGDEIVREKYRAAKAQKSSGKVAGFGSLVWEAWQAGMPRDSRIPREWLECAEQAKKAASGPFLLRTCDLFSWPDPTFLVADFLMQNENACLYGPPKAGKTFVALDIALSLAAGLPVFGKMNVLRPGEAVVYLSGEGHAGMKRRILAWYQTHSIEPERELPFFYKAEVPASEKGTEEALRYVAGIRQFCNPVLVVIDTMARSLGKADESTSSAAAGYLDLTETLRKELNTAVLTLAHEGKTEGRGVRGSSAFVAGFDAVWHLEANKDNRTAKLEGEWLKDADDLGPHCFKVEPVYVEGMENGKGAVLRHINLSDYKSPTTGRLEHPGESEDAIRRHLMARNASNWYCGLTDRALAEIIIGPIEMWAPDESGKKDHGAHLREIERCYDRLRGRHRKHPTKGNYGPFDGKVGSMSTGAGGTQLEWHWHLCG